MGLFGDSDPRFVPVVAIPGFVRPVVFKGAPGGGERFDEDSEGTMRSDKLRVERWDVRIKVGCSPLAVDVAESFRHCSKSNLCGALRV